MNTPFHNKFEKLSDNIYADSNITLPGRYVFILTNLCNLNCSFCFQNKQYKKKSMTLENWISVADQLPEYARVTLTGGEPLLFTGFKEIFRYVAERFDCNIITNGLLLDKTIIDFLLSFPKFKVLSISIDDIGNKIRNVSPGKWTYLEKMLNYFVRKKKEAGHDVVLDIKTMILDDNTSELMNIHEYSVKQLQCDTHVYQLLKGSPIQHSDILYESDDITQKSCAPVYNRFEEIKSELNRIKEYNINNNYTKCFLHPEFGSLTNHKEPVRFEYMNSKFHVSDLYESCKLPWSSVHINFDGSLFPCLSLSMGNVKGQPLTNIIMGDEFRSFRSLIKKNGTVQGCNRCGWLRIKNRQ